MHRHGYPAESLGGCRDFRAKRFLHPNAHDPVVAKNEVRARRLAGDKTPPAFLTAREVLEYATIEGAKANGLERKVGSLTPGKEADIILLRTDRLNVMPMNNAVGAVVTSMGPQNVDTVMIAGKIKKQGGQLAGVDMPRVTRILNEARE